MLQLDAGIVGGDLPVDLGVLLIPLRCPSTRFLLECLQLRPVLVHGWPLSALNSTSAIFSQLLCLAVGWISSYCAHARVRIGVQGSHSRSRRAVNA